VLAVIAINAVISFLPGISLLGHLGGFVVGLVVTAALVYAPREHQRAVQIGALVTIGALLVVAAVLRAAV